MKKLRKIEYFKQNNIKIKHVWSNNMSGSTFWMDEESKVYANGWNYNYNLGLVNDKENKSNPTFIPFLSGNDKHIIDIKSNMYYSVALDKNGNVYVSGSPGSKIFFSDKDKKGDDYYESWNKVDSLSNQHIVKISVGYCHSLFVNDNGDVWSCGYEYSKYLGLGFDRNESVFPTRISYFTKNNIKIKHVNCGSSHSLALDVNGNVYGFGDNRYGQCGNGTIKSRDSWILTPRLIESLKKHNVVKIAAGYYHSLCVTDKGDYFMFGNNNYNECVAPKGEHGMHIVSPYCVNGIIEKEIIKNQDKEIHDIFLGYHSTVLMLMDKCVIERIKNEEEKEREYKIKNYEILLKKNELLNEEISKIQSKLDKKEKELLEYEKEVELLKKEKFVWSGLSVWIYLFENCD